MDRRSSQTALVMLNCNRHLSEASMNPHQTGEAYNNLLISVAWVTSHMALPPSPWYFRTMYENKEGLGPSTDQVVDIGFKREMVLNSPIQDHIWLTLCIPWIGGGAWQVGISGLRIIISVYVLYLICGCYLQIAFQLDGLWLWSGNNQIKSNICLR